jgi:hypothetical protein
MQENAYSGFANSIKRRQVSFETSDVVIQVAIVHSPLETKYAQHHATYLNDRPAPLRCPADYQPMTEGPTLPLRTTAIRVGSNGGLRFAIRVSFRRKCQSVSIWIRGSNPPRATLRARRLERRSQGRGAEVRSSGQPAEHTAQAGHEPIAVVTGRKRRGLNRCRSCALCALHQGFASTEITVWRVPPRSWQYSSSESVRTISGTLPRSSIRAIDCLGQS